MTSSDWHELLGEGATRTPVWWLFPPLAMAARYVPGSVPAGLLAELGSVCPRRLRGRYESVPIYDVSWSNLRIEALPGREWTRSLGETLRFVRSRLYPGREAIEEAAALRATDVQFMQAGWHRTSHVGRVTRWLFARPPRVHTIMAVSAALQEAAS
jgi:hypothetical protein